jgi:hypothetical protein
VAADHLARFGIFPAPEAEPSPTRVAAHASEPAVEEAPAQLDEQEGAPEVPAVAARPDPEVPAPASDPEAAPPSVALVQFEDRVLLPDFSGLSVPEVTRITESQPVIVRFQGRGRAVAQDPPAGTIVPGGSIVTIEFGDARPDGAADPTGAAAGAPIGERAGRRTGADANGGIS